jgi:[CysO sulfur-carrier protein]-S-L-cysteine hydrolase
MDHLRFESMNLILPAHILEQVIQHAKNAYPNEACGFLLGRNAVDRFIPTKNVSLSPDQYEIDPAELIATLRALRETGESLLAIFHSHPHGPAEPSKTDIERAYYPESAHLIVSLAELERPQVVAFRIIGGDIFPIEVHAIV